MTLTFIYGPDQSTAILQEQKVSLCLVTCKLLFSEVNNISIYFNFSYGFGRTSWKATCFFHILKKHEYIGYKFIPNSQIKQGDQVSKAEAKNLNSWFKWNWKQSIAANVFVNICHFMAYMNVTMYCIYVLFIYLYMLNFLMLIGWHGPDSFRWECLHVDLKCLFVPV